MLKFPCKFLIVTFDLGTWQRKMADQWATAPSVATILASEKETKDKATYKKAMGS